MTEQILCNQCEQSSEHFYKIRGDVLCETCVDEIMAAAQEAMDD